MIGAMFRRRNTIISESGDEPLGRIPMHEFKTLQFSPDKEVAKFVEGKNRPRGKLSIDRCCNNVDELAPRFSEQERFPFGKRQDKFKKLSCH